MARRHQSTRNKACLQCQKQKVRCTMKDGETPCQRCQRRRVDCILPKNPYQRCTYNETSTSKLDMIEDLRNTRNAINSLIAGKEQLPLGPLKSDAESLLDPWPSNSLKNDAPDWNDEMQGITPHTQDSVEPLNPIPITSLYEVTRLGSSRFGLLSPSLLKTETPNLIDPPQDMVSMGKIEFNDADRLVTRFLKDMDHYLYGISARFQNTEDVRRASRLLFTVMCTSAALHEPHGDALFRLCNKELRKLISDFVFAAEATVDDFQGLCIASFWLSDVSWSVSGLAIRRAFEFQLSQSFGIVVGDRAVQQPIAGKVRFASEEDALVCLRVWYLFFICDHQMSILYARPSSFGVQAPVNDWKRYLSAVKNCSTDVRIASQIELLLLLESVTKLLGHGVDARIPLILRSQLEAIDSKLDQWVTKWANMCDDHDQIGDFPRKALELHYHLAKLFLASHVFRGLSADRTNDHIPQEFHPMAQSAVRNAKSIIDLVTHDKTMKGCFVAMPHYYHTFVAYACSFLLKLHTEEHEYLDMQREDTISSVAQVVELCQRGECASHHPILWIGAGLQKLKINCARLMSNQYETRQSHEKGYSEDSRPLSFQASPEGVSSPTTELLGRGETDVDGVWPPSKVADEFISRGDSQGSTLESLPLTPNLVDHIFNKLSEGTFEEDWLSILPSFGQEHMGLELL